MDFAPINLREGESPHIETLIGAIVTTAMRDALELGTRIHPIHMQCVFDNIKAQSEEWRRRNPEHAHQDYQDAHFARAREILKLLGWEW